MPGSEEFVHCSRIDTPSDEYHHYQPVKVFLMGGSQETLDCLRFLDQLFSSDHFNSNETPLYIKHATANRISLSSKEDASIFLQCLLILILLDNAFPTILIHLAGRPGTSNSSDETSRRPRGSQICGFHQVSFVIAYCKI